jgi:hypothetical protein
MYIRGRQTIWQYAPKADGRVFDNYLLILLKGDISSALTLQFLSISRRALILI